MAKTPEEKLAHDVIEGMNIDTLTEYAYRWLVAFYTSSEGQDKFREDQAYAEEISSDTYLWVRVGDAGEYEKFDDLDSAIEYLNELRVGKIVGWILGGFITPKYHWQDHVSIFYGDTDANGLADLTDSNKEIVENSLEESYL